MTEDTAHNEHNAQPWYVMCHLNPRQIETLLRMDSAGKFRAPGQEPLPPYRFYVPYQYMPLMAAGPSDDDYSDRYYNARDDVNALRNDLRCFVFIQASEERIRAVVRSDWNTKGRLRLNYYRDPARQKVTISDAEMRLLIATIQDRHLQFYIDQPLVDFVPGDKVILKMAPWTGKRGDIRKVAVKKGRLCMTISMNILGRTKSINFTDIQAGDVVFEDAEKGRMLTDNPVTNYEEELIDILSHRFGRHPSSGMAEGDLQRLKRLVSYDHIFVDDEAEHARFTALRLICASLLQSSRKQQLYQRQVVELLDGCDTPANDAQAYLMTALFVATRQARWRTALKDYRNTHPDCAPVFRRYHAILKDLKAVHAGVSCLF